MQSSPVKSIKQLNNFLKLENTKFEILNKNDAYQFIRKTISNLKYRTSSKANKGNILKYLTLITGYSKSHTKRLVLKAVSGYLPDPRSTKNLTSFNRIYINEDIELLADFDGLANYPNGTSLQESFRRMYVNFNDKRFIRLKNISLGHIYNLRKTSIYRHKTLKYELTKPVSLNQIGIREKPQPNNMPGYIRVDSVHGGDKEGEKGVYYVNFVDEVTQFEIVVCVKGISEKYLLEVWEEVLVSFPFEILQFHSDNGSEFINKKVADILNRLNIRQSKSRPRRHNDNGLVESKNGWVIRKHFGYMFVDREYAPIINDFLDKYFNRFLNYHRPCAFPTSETEKNGKKRIFYKKEDYKTPYEKLKEIDPNGNYLQEGLTYAKLDTLAYSISDYEYLKKMKIAQHKMLRIIRIPKPENLIA